jgi:DNA-binding response OmpR family regulator
MRHDDLLREVWGPGYEGEYHTLHVSIHRLRQKLARFEERAAIKTVAGVGYELVIAS